MATKSKQSPQPKGVVNKDVSARSGPRKRKPARYHSFRVSRRIKHTAKLPSAYSLFKQSFVTLRRFWKPFAFILLIYALLQLFFVRGFSSSLNLTDIKDTLSTALHGSTGKILTSFSIFTALLTNKGSDTAGVGALYQTMLVIIMSLAIIWALRQLLSGAKIRARDAFYKGMYPLIPFLLIVVVMALQLLPLVLGNFLYTSVVNRGVAVTAFERLLWLLVFGLLALLSVYMITSSAFALYVVTLPDMTPMKALRSARQLVLNRRWTILRKVIFLPIALVFTGLVLMIPVILWLTPLASWIFFVLSIIGVALAHTYLYQLYREML